MRTGIEWLVSGVEQGDCLFFHYSGHGGQMKDASCCAKSIRLASTAFELRLISAQADCNEDDGFDETLVPCDYTSCGQIPDDALWKKLVNMAPNRAEIKAARWRRRLGAGTTTV